LTDIIDRHHNTARNVCVFAVITHQLQTCLTYAQSVNNVQQRAYTPTWSESEGWKLYCRHVCIHVHTRTCDVCNESV